MNITIIYTQVDKQSKDADSYNEVLITAKEIKKILTKNNYNVKLCKIKNSLELIKKQFSKLKKDTDIIFNLAEGIGSDTSKESEIVKILEELNFIYTGSSYKTLYNSTNKIIQKQILEKSKIKTPKHQIIKNVDEKLKINFPVIVKPTKEGGSIGIRNDSVVYNQANFKKKVKEIITTYKQEALVEEYIDGKEFNKGILKTKNKIIALPTSQIVFSLPKNKPQILTYESKWEEDSIEYKNTNVECPAKINEKLEKELEKITIKTFKTFKCQDYARVDFRVNKKNQVYVLEINANPCINPIDSGYSKQLKAKNISYEKFILELINNAKKRLKKLKKIN